jgi:hypothetical protein
MKHIFITFIVLAITNIATYSQKNSFATCKVLERNHKVHVEFTDEIKYLGSNYEKTVMYFSNKKQEFSDGQAAVSYLWSARGWELCGNPIPLKNGAIMWVLRHRLDGNIVNFRRNVDAFNRGQKAYGKTQDEVYDSFGN